jgi:hypothetical protein
LNLRETNFDILKSEPQQGATMKKELRARFWIEAILATLSLALLLLTLISQDWIERVFNVDPDNHSGALEWAIVVALLLVAAMSIAFARSEWRRNTSNV